MALKNLWHNPEYRKNVLGGQKRRFEDCPSEHKRYSVIAKEKWEKPEFCEKMSEGHRRYWQNPDAHKKCSTERGERYSNPSECKKLSDAQKKSFKTPERIKKHSEGQKRRYNNPQERKKQSIQGKERWEDAEFVKKMMIARNIKPNKLEQFVGNVLQKHYPDEWKFNGDGSCGVVLNGLIPDFINVNGEKKVIEVFGEAFHNPEKAFMEVTWKRQEFGRKAVFAQLGFNCVVLWGEEIKKHGEEYIISMINEEGIK